MLAQDCDKVTAEIRGIQIHSMESSVWKSLAGYLVAVVVATLLAYEHWSPVLDVWVPVVLIVGAARMALALRTALKPVRPLHAASERRLMAVTALVSAVLVAGPIWIALHSDGLVSAIMIMLVVSAMWGGALVQASTFSCAVSYTAMTIPVWLVCLYAAGATRERLGLTLLFVIMVVIAIDNVHRYARSFEKGQRQRLDLAVQGDHLKQQADVIALLLKEHEDQSSDWLWQIDATGRIVSPSARFAQVFAGRGEVIEGRSFVGLLTCRGVEGNAEGLAALADHIDGARSFRDLLVPGALDGSPRWWAISGRLHADVTGVVRGYRGVMVDVTEAKQAQARIVYMAHHDSLTGLANRVFFRQRLDALLFASGGKDASLLSIDLDGFKPVNDRYGHPVGDALLIAIADRLRALVPGEGMVARLGGDEFAIRSSICDPESMGVFCRRLLEKLQQPYKVAGHEFSIGASIGIALAPADGETAEELIKNADAALYRAKRDGRGTYRFFVQEMDRHLQERMLLTQELREALGEQQFVLEYQPFIDAGSGIITGCEALIRWRHPSRGAISPAQFIPLAEISGLIVPIGAWVIETACAQVATWPADKRVSVNISPVQLKDSGLPEQIEQALRKHALAPCRLEIEVTEAVFIDDADRALDVLRRIRGLGVKIALDDFGTGYSSLSYLRKFPFDKVKVDRSFVTEIENRHDSRVIVQSIRDIALGLGMTMTAEGVETAGQALHLMKSGCHELQGFLFSKPQSESGIAGMFDPNALMDQFVSLLLSLGSQRPQRGPANEGAVSASSSASVPARVESASRM